MVSEQQDRWAGDSADSLSPACQPGAKEVAVFGIYNQGKKNN